VYVSNLCGGISYHTIKRDWAAAGPIKFVSVLPSGTSAIITFAEYGGAQAAIDQWHQTW
jgi:hypothetical protein